jgi:hypothetical protein
MRNALIGLGILFGVAVSGGNVYAQDIAPKEDTFKYIHKGDSPENMYDCALHITQEGKDIIVRDDNCDNQLESVGHYRSHGCSSGPDCTIYVKIPSAPVTEERRKSLNAMLKATQNALFEK